MNKTEQSRITYNEKARNYEDTMEGRVTRPLKRLLLDEIDVKDGQRVLDVACGTGDLIAAFSRKADIQAYGTDLAEQMIEVARATNPDITFSVSPAYPLPFDDSSIDIITVSAAFHHFEQPQQFADECMRVLSGGGKLYVGEFSYHPVQRFIFNLLLPLLKSGDVKLYSRKQLTGFFLKAGFEVVDIKSIKRCEVFIFQKAA